MDEGVITYDIKYLEDEKTNPIITLLPTQMVYKFKENNYIQRVEGWMGIFIMAGINYEEEKKHSALLKIMNEKYVYVGDLAFGYDEYPGMEIEYVNETKMIAGFKCKKANIVFKNGEYENFSVFYCDEFDIKDPNFFNPFKSIPGVCMEYTYELFGITTSLTAVKFENIEVDPVEFEVPSEYKNVSKDEMEEVINNLM